MSITNFRIAAEGNRVILEIDGRVTSIPWEHALEVARGIMSKARQAEEQEKALGIARDDALLLRLGVPIGLSNDLAIRAEAEHIAQYDPDLRKALPGGIKSEAHFGTPTVIRHQPRRRNNGKGS